MLCANILSTDLKWIIHHKLATNFYIRRKMGVGEKAKIQQWISDGLVCHLILEWNVSPSFSYICCSLCEEEKREEQGRTERASPLEDAIRSCHRLHAEKGKLVIFFLFCGTFFVIYIFLLIYFCYIFYIFCIFFLSILL